MGSGDPTPSRSWLGNRNFLARLWRAAASSDWSLPFCERGESPLSHIPPKTRAANGVRCHQFLARSANRRLHKVARKHGNAGLQTGSAPRSGAKPHIATGEEARGRLGTPTSGRHSLPEAGGVAYRHTPGWFPSRRCPHPRRWRSRARPRFRSVSIAPLAPLCGAVPTGGRPSSPGGGSLACASLRLVAWAPCAMFSVRVAPSATRRALPRLRNAG